MQIPLLKAAPSFDRPLEILTACHRRIERYLQILEKVSRCLQSGEFSDPFPQGLREALNYFENGGVHHTRDEEDSLFPRLRPLRGKEARAVLAHLERLAADHGRVAEAHGELSRIAGELLRRAPAVDSSSARRFAEIVSLLSSSYAPHIEIEDQIIFPFAAAVLPPVELLSLGREMARRRGIDPARISEPWPGPKKVKKPSV